MALPLRFNDNANNSLRKCIQIKNKLYLRFVHAFIIKLDVPFIFQVIKIREWDISLEINV